MKMKSQREVIQSCPALSDPMDCSPPGSSAHGIFQTRVLEWGAIAFSVLRVRGNEKFGQSKKSWAMGELIFYEEVIKLCKIIQSFDI